MLEWRRRGRRFGRDLRDLFRADPLTVGHEDDVAALLHHADNFAGDVAQGHALDRLAGARQEFGGGLARLLDYESELIEEVHRRHVEVGGTLRGHLPLAVAYDLVFHDHGGTRAHRRTRPVIVIGREGLEVAGFFALLSP